MGEAYDLDAAPGFWLNKTFNRLRTATLSWMQEGGFELTPEQWAVLVRLWEDDGSTSSALAESTFRDKAGVTRLVDALVAKGWVERRPDPSDRRAKTLHVTPAGRALEATLVPHVRAFLAVAYEGVSEEELATLRDILQRIHANVDAAAPS